MADVLGVTMMDERLWIPNQKHRHNLVKNRGLKLDYLMGSLRLVCSDFNDLLEYLEINGHKRFSRSVSGRVKNYLLVTCMVYQGNLAMFQYDWDGFFKTNWHMVMEYLRRMTKVCILHYGYSDHKFYTYAITNKNMKRMSTIFWDGMHQPAQDMIIHYKKILEREKIQT